MEYDQAFQNRAAQTAAVIHQAIPPIPAAMRSGHFPPEATVKHSTRMKNANGKPAGPFKFILPH